ncbi:hypothetical protein [Microlunatus flavus]|uniref:WD40-like Beta Propeller Repeat n=1 Tax=Microlunatus flavus TaxID=1036181 RepID=A0A1H9HGC3_9ACTN|nr:hypothetical protein [Microlunatus flavus]SEQ61390.1 hypothetical protein SAMN05421756_104243 [Microlunatus flavus]
MEDLDVEEHPPLRRNVWVAVGLVVLLVVAGVVRLADGAPTPQAGAGSPVAAPSRPERTTWPGGGEAGSGTLYALANGEVHRIDVASGAVASTGVRLDAIDTVLTPVRGGVLVWLRNGADKRLLGPGADDVRMVRGALRRGAAFLPGPDGSVWASATRASGSGVTTWRLVDTQGRVAARTQVPGRATADGAGGLLGVLEDGFRPVQPRHDDTLVAGELLATGRDGYLSRTCTDDGQCTALLHRAGADPVEVGLAPPMDSNPGTLSPANRFVTLTVLGEPAGAVQVRAIDSPRVLESFMEDGPAGGSAAWTSDHWVALVSSSGTVVLYDATGDEVVRPHLDLGSTVQQLVWSPT